MNGIISLIGSLNLVSILKRDDGLSRLMSRTTFSHLGRYRYPMMSTTPICELGRSASPVSIGPKRAHYFKSSFTLARCLFVFFACLHFSSSTASSNSLTLILAPDSHYFSPTQLSFFSDTLFQTFGFLSRSLSYAFHSYP